MASGAKLAYVPPLVVASAALKPHGAAAQDGQFISGPEANALVPNELPVAVAGNDVYITDADGDGAEAIMLDGSASYDPDGQVVDYQWWIGGQLIAVGPAVAVTFPVGAFIVTLVVTDANGEQAVDDVAITVEAAPPPEPVVEQAQAVEQAPAVDPVPPPAPRDLSAFQNEALVELGWWLETGNAHGFRVYRTQDGGATWSVIKERPLEKPNYRDKDVAPGITYSYVVSAFNDFGESAPSNVATITVQ